jgi:hypothetical protein
MKPEIPSLQNEAFKQKKTRVTFRRDETCNSLKSTAVCFGSGLKYAGKN